MSKAEKKNQDELLYWKCSHCNHVIQAAQHPNVCPACQEKCAVRNVTCYRPECKDQGYDPSLMK